MSTFIMNTAWLVVGYVACIFTWQKVKVFVNGAEVEAQALRDKARAMIKGLK
jgi:hypothetical protein